jgi:hypothetical protein
VRAPQPSFQLDDLERRPLPRRRHRHRRLRQIGTSWTQQIVAQPLFEDDPDIAIGETATDPSRDLDEPQGERGKVNLG